MGAAQETSAMPTQNMAHLTTMIKLLNTARMNAIAEHSARASSSRSTETATRSAASVRVAWTLETELNTDTRPVPSANAHDHVICKLTIIIVAICKNCNL